MIVPQQIDTMINNLLMSRDYKYVYGVYRKKITDYVHGDNTQRNIRYY